MTVSPAMTQSQQRMLLGQLLTLLYDDLQNDFDFEYQSLDQLRHYVMRRPLTDDARTALTFIVDAVGQACIQVPTTEQAGDQVADRSPAELREQLTESLRAWLRVWHLCWAVPDDSLDRNGDDCVRKIWWRAVVPAWKAFELLASNEAFYQLLGQLNNELALGTENWRKDVNRLKLALEAYLEWKQHPTVSRRFTGMHELQSAFIHWRASLGLLRI